MPIRYIPYLYFFDENKNYIGEKKLKIKQEEYNINYNRYKNPLMVSLELETLPIEGEYWLLELVIKMGKNYYYPHFCMLEKIKVTFSGVNGYDYESSFKINQNNTFEKLSISFELNHLPYYCDNKSLLSEPKTIEEIISKHKELHHFNV